MGFDYMNKKYKINKDILIGDSGKSLESLLNDTLSALDQLNRRGSYIADVGSKDGWNYIVLKNGMRMMFRWVHFTLNITSSEGSLYYANIPQINFPNGFYNNSPVVITQGEMGGGYALNFVAKEFKKDHMAGWVYTNVPIENAAIYLNIFVIGS